jgi:hypothetical protein
VEQIAEYAKEIEQLFLSHEDNEVFRSLPGAGKRLAPRLLAEIGDDPARYGSAASLQALGGTSPVLFQSGTYSKPHRRQGCIKPLRNALHQFAWQSTQQEAWAKAYYERKRTEGQSHSVAVRARSNIWARILFAMLQSHQPYVSATFETAKQLHALKAASQRLTPRGKTACFFAFSRACLLQTMQVACCQGKRSGLTAERGMVHLLMLT